MFLLVGNPLKVVDISYTDRNTHFNLMHKDNENDLSVFPGKWKCM